MTFLKNLIFYAENITKNHEKDYFIFSYKTEIIYRMRWLHNAISIPLIWIICEDCHQKVEKKRIIFC